MRCYSLVCCFPLVWFACSDESEIDPNAPTEPEAPTEVRPFHVVSFNGAVDDRRTQPFILIQYMRIQAPDVVTIQEIDPRDSDLTARALPLYDFVTHSAGLMVGVRRDRFDLTDSITLALSDVPEDLGSATWGNVVPRGLLGVEFADRDSGQSAWVFTAQLDRDSQASRIRSVPFILEQIDEQAGGSAAVLSGLLEEHETSELIASIVDAGFVDTFRLVDPSATQVGTEHDRTGVTDGRKLDYVFVRDGSVSEASIVTESFPAADGTTIYPSSHYPVDATVTDWGTGAVREIEEPFDSGTSRPGESIHFLTYNVRGPNPTDGLNYWPFRVDVARELILSENPDIFGSQETAGLTLDEFQYFVGAGYSVYRGDGTRGQGDGELLAIFYRSDRFVLDQEKSGTFYLNETVETPGPGFGDDTPRGCTFAHLTDNRTDKSFYVYNTHADNDSVIARSGGIDVIMQMVANRDEDIPAIAMGDFNTFEARTVDQLLDPVDGDVGVDFLDTFLTVHPERADEGTFSHWDGFTGGDKVDFILAPEGTTVLEADIVRFNVDGRYTSDHYPVSAEIVL